MRVKSTSAVLLAALACLGSGVPCPEGINVVPRYGRAKKCRAQLKLDQEFIIQAEQREGSRQLGAVKYVGFGWAYLTKGELETAMKRFNQAWLLDSTNREVDWGFGTTLRMMRQNKASLPFFRAAIRQNSAHNKVWRDAALSYGNIWGETRQAVYLDTAILYLRKSIQLDSKQAYVYADLAQVYHFSAQPDSARNYLRLADQLNPAQVDWQLREMINRK